MATMIRTLRCWISCLVDFRGFVCCRVVDIVATGATDLAALRKDWLGLGPGLIHSLKHAKIDLVVHLQIEAIGATDIPGLKKDGLGLVLVNVLMEGADE